jgi:chemotaxis response regulator CheB
LKTIKQQCLQHNGINEKITVLLADDNILVHRDIREMLELEGDLEVVGEACNSREAVAMVKKLHPALILMDVAMPVLNGLQDTKTPSFDF